MPADGNPLPQETGEDFWSGVRLHPARFAALSIAALPVPGMKQNASPARTEPSQFVRYSPIGSRHPGDGHGEHSAAIRMFRLL